MFATASRLGFWCGLSGKAFLEMEESPHEQGRSPEATYDVVVIGAGQAGLAMRYFLKQQQGRKSVILEAAHSIGSATDVPGLYFLGLTWQHTRGSALIGWVKDDAEFIAEQIAAFHEDPGRLADERESAAEDGQAAPAASRERA